LLNQYNIETNQPWYHTHDVSMQLKGIQYKVYWTLANW